MTSKQIVGERVDCLEAQADSSLVCPTCGSPHLERLSSGNYRCVDEDKIFGANEVAAPGITHAPPSQVLVSTAPYLPGYQIVRYHREVFGCVVRSRNYVSNLGAGAKALIGGELHGLTKLIRETRRTALERLRDETRALGANAVISLRFDSSEYGDYATELVAYGTAVTVVPDGKGEE